MLALPPECHTATAGPEEAKLEIGGKQNGQHNRGEAKQRGRRRESKKERDGRTVRQKGGSITECQEGREAAKQKDSRTERARR